MGAVVLACVATAAELSREKLAAAMEATVYIKVQRLFRNQSVPTSGSGFFVSPRGHIITNWHVVAPQMEIEIQEKVREISTATGSIDVVISSGTAGERAVPAQVLALDRKRDLAVLKVAYAPTSWLPVSQQGSLAITDQIWAVGYPFGELIALNKKNPEVTVTGGRVTALRRGEQGDIEAVQIDAAVNPGNSGGPILAEAGEAIGVVYAGISGGNSTSFAIAPDRLRAFVADEQLKVAVDPPGVYVRHQPIKVLVGPLLLDLTGTRCELALSGDNIDTVRQELEWSGAQFAGLLSVPPAQAEGKKTDAYLLELRILGAGGQQVLARRYSLPVREDQVARVASARDPAEMMRDRRELGNRSETSHLQPGLPDEEGAVTEARGAALAEIAKNTKLKRGADGKVAITDSTLLDLAFVGKPENYIDLATEELRNLARAYDRYEQVVLTLKQALNDMQLHEDYYPNFGRLGSPDTTTIQGWLATLRPRADAAAKQVAEAALCRCPDGKWYEASAKKLCTSCTAPTLPGR